MVSSALAPRRADAPDADALTGLDWRLVSDGPRAGPRNMALDHALAECVADGRGVVRLYSWARPTVSFGRHEPAAGMYSTDVAATRGVAFVRRPTGGRAVAHHDEMTYSVVVPLDRRRAPRAVYQRINRALAAGLSSLTRGIELSGAAAVAPPSAGPCFRHPAPGELVVAGRKLAGSAQARIGGALLQHGSILIGGSQRLLEDLSGGRAQAGTPVTLAALGVHVSIDEVAAAIAKSLRRSLGGSWYPGGFSPDELEAALRLERDRYAKESWTWRT